MLNQSFLLAQHTNNCLICVKGSHDCLVLRFVLSSSATKVLAMADSTPTYTMRETGLPLRPRRISRVVPWVMLCTHCMYLPITACTMEGTVQPLLSRTHTHTHTQKFEIKHPSSHQIQVYHWSYSRNADARLVFSNTAWCASPSRLYSTIFLS